MLRLLADTPAVAKIPIAAALCLAVSGVAAAVCGVLDDYEDHFKVTKRFVDYLDNHPASNGGSGSGGGTQQPAPDPDDPASCGVRVS